MLWFMGSQKVRHDWATELNWLTDSIYKLNNQSDNIQPWRTPFQILSQSMVPCPVLTVVSWTPCRFHRRQVNLSRRILSITLLTCVMSAIVQQFEHSLSLPFFGIGMKTDLFQLKDTNVLSLKDSICKHYNNNKKMCQQIQNLISFLTSFRYFLKMLSLFNIYLITHFVWPHITACGTLVPQPAIEPSPSAVVALSPNHWITREFPVIKYFYLIIWFDYLFIWEHIGLTFSQFLYCGKIYKP